MKSRTLRVLLAEDGIMETGLTLRAWCADRGQQLELVFVSNARKLPETLLQSQPHIAFLAFSMLQPNPPLAVSLLHRASPHIPLILFIRPADKESVFKCLQAGAENYMLEGYLDVPTLDHVLHTAISRKVGPSPIPAPQSTVQSLSNLLNRSQLVRQIQHSSPDSVLSGSRLLISVRLLNLKKLQASADRAAVERVLLQTAQQLRSFIRRSDLLAYVAPGIFAMVIFDAGDSCRASLNRRIESRLAQLNQPDPCRDSLKISIHTCSCNNISSSSFSQLLADLMSTRKQPSLPPLLLSGHSFSPPAAGSTL